jgi:hypothetical protein
MDAVIKELINLLKSRWPSKSALVILILLAGICLLLLFSAIDIEKITGANLVIGITVLLTLGFVWYYSNRIPRASKGKVGFAVAIATETEKQNKQIARDFVVTLRDLLYNSSLRHHFSFVELPQYHALRMNSPDASADILQSSRCHFMVFGNARTRRIQGEAGMFLNWME